MKLPRVSRDSVLFSSGILGVIHETMIYKGTERGQLLILFAAMLGLPAFLRKDESREEE